MASIINSPLIAKLNLILNDIKFKVLDDSIIKYKKELTFIANKYPNAIITGSIALNLYGLIDRPYNDIDIIIDKIEDGKVYLPMFNNDMKNRLGYRYLSKEIFSDIYIVNLLFLPFINAIYKLLSPFIDNSYKFDFFIKNENTEYDTFIFNNHKFKIHKAEQIIEQKSKM
jgi:hypothetical protein